ncbi:MAG: response regulator [Deltaproteobacteria bacterium]|nr:response regulator [Deltaproteobacteria bacterium]
MESKLLEILLVDDNEDDITIFREALRKNPFVDLVGTAQDGEEAMAYLRHDAGYENARVPDLILLDINMPRKNGFEVLKEIKEEPKFKYLPVIMFTTSEREEDIVRSYGAGACSFISKPVDFTDLEKLIDELKSYWTTVSRIPRHAPDSAN